MNNEYAYEYEYNFFFLYLQEISKYFLFGLNKCTIFVNMITNTFDFTFTSTLQGLVYS